MIVEIFPEKAPETVKNQFFINTAGNKILDHTGQSADGRGYCVFGEVTEAVGVMDRIPRDSITAHDPLTAEAPIIQVSKRNITVIK